MTQLQILARIKNTVYSRINRLENKKLCIQDEYATVHALMTAERFVLRT